MRRIEATASSQPSKEFLGFNFTRTSGIQVHGYMLMICNCREIKGEIRLKQALFFQCSKKTPAALTSLPFSRVSPH